MESAPLPPRSGKTSRVWERAALAALVLVVVSWLSFQLYRRELNSQLIDAAWRGSAAASLSALARGADPRARVPPRWPHEAAYEEMTGHSAGPPVGDSALMVALSRHADEKLILALLRRGAVPEGHVKFTPDEARAARKRHAIGWAVEGDFAADRYSVLNEIRLYRRVLARFPESAEVQQALAESLLWLGRFSDAARAALRATELAPGDRAVSRLLAVAVERLRAAEQVGSALPHPRQVLDVRRASQPGGTTVLWVALTGVLDPSNDMLTSSGRPELEVWSGSRGAFHRLSRKSLEREGPGRQAWLSAQLRLCDVTQDHVPEAVVLAGHTGAAWEPSRLFVFSLQAGRLRRKFMLDAHYPAELVDLDGDGSCEIRLTRDIGRDMSHADQPRWIDIFRWDGRRFSEAGARFPGQYDHLARSVRSLIGRFPVDPELWEYHGRVLEIQRRTDEAVAAYRRAISLAVVQERRAPPEDRAEAREKVRQARRRLAALHRPQAVVGAN
jgi:tetratricopeptide (TPR) repeat protein